ncbi:nuclear receptor coactivator 7 isoform X2 [Mixophyes fleayi]|uniref:nuclear receptor coactivator 7 isoform X2 n=1 Tax=Mixophyes fleayi TaxID=3061075 RepID=UPI003F4E26AA
MDSKEEKKERRQGYFARLKKKKITKQNPEFTSANSHAGSTSIKDDTSTGNLGQVAEKVPDEEKKKKKGQGKQHWRSEIKRHSAGEIHSNKNEKREKKMVTKKPLGTVEYIASGTDTLNCIALKFNITPNKLVELNKLFTHTIVPGQVLYVPVCDLHSSVRGSNSGVTSPLSSDAEYDKLPDADLARKATKPIERVLSSTSEEEEPVVVKFLKMNCRYITDGKGVVGGVMIVTPNNVMFDPHKSDPLVIENGCEEYGLICPMEEVVSVALYSDISHMKIKDALPSDIPKDLCPLYRPGEWEDLSSEKDINPFSKFKSLNKGKRQNGVTGVGTVEQTKIAEIEVTTEEQDANKSLDNISKVQLSVNNTFTKETEQSTEIILGTESKKSGSSPTEEDFIELVDSLAQQNDNEICEGSDGKMVVVVPQEDLNCNGTVDVFSGHISDSIARINIEDIPSEQLPVLENPQTTSETKNIELCLSPTKGDKALSSEVAKSEVCVKTEENIGEAATKMEKTQLKSDHTSERSPDTLSPCSSEESSQKEAQMDSESELKLWLLKRMQGPIEDMLPSKEEKSKIPPMFMCIKVGKPMRKSFAVQPTAMVQQYVRKRKQPEYWFAVPQERVDHLYTFFVQWSPDVYGKDAKEQGFVVVEKDELTMIDNFFSEPSTKSWEIITVEEAKRRKSTCSYEEEEEEEEALEDFLPDLKQTSNLLEDMHIEKLAHRLPARVQGYPWHLVYSTRQHGTSLKTLYRNLASLDCPVLLVIKDMDSQVFGTYATHPFRLSDHYYGTGETFLFTFNPDFKAFKWSGENSYFINGDIGSLEVGGGGGRFGLWLDSDLYHGRSNSCSTFNNDILSKKEDFIVQDIEVWAFA